MTARVYLDTNIFIVTIETRGSMSQAGWNVLSAMDSGQFSGVTSEITLAELLPKPMVENDDTLQKSYEELLTDGSHFHVAPIDRTILLSAARLRANDRSLRLPDAVHVATALKTGCSLFLTGDRRLAVPNPITSLRLDRDTLDTIMRSPA